MALRTPLRASTAGGRSDSIADRARWTIAGRAALTKVTRLEAERLVGVRSLRDDLQRLLLELRAAFPAIDGLLIYVVEAERVVGFAELRLEIEQFQWYGPHLAPERAAS